MSTILNTNGDALQVPALDKNVKGKFYVVTATWNSDVTDVLGHGALQVIREAGVAEENIKSLKVPGTVELVNVAAMLVKKPDTAAVIVIGCVIRGDTPHFDYVCQIAAQGVASINSLGNAPVIFGVLTVDNLAQAMERAGGSLGNKGAEAASAAISMANIHSRFAH